MFGAGWTEMLIIGVVALVVIGPKDLPIVMRKLGRIVATVRRMGTEFQNEIAKTTGLEEIADLKRSLTEPLRQTSDEIMREFNKVTATGAIEPSGIIKPTDPNVESVYDQIAATSGITAPPPVMKPLAADEPSPAPAEASVLPPAAPKRKRAAKGAPVAKSTAVAAPKSATKNARVKAADAKPLADAKLPAATAEKPVARAKPATRAAKSATKAPAKTLAAKAAPADAVAGVAPTPKAVARPRAKKA